MDTVKSTFLKKFIDSKKKNTLDPSPSAEEQQRPQGDVLNFNASLQVLYLQYAKLKELSNGDIRDFIKLALCHLKGFKKNRAYESYEIFKTLLYEMDYPALTQQLQLALDQGIELLEKRIDYFCSYTRKGLPDINSNYEPMIYRSFGVKQDTHPRDWRENNYVAILLVKYLNDHGFNSYFLDIDKIVNGEIIEKRIFLCCEHTTVLLLLAQQETFRDRDDETNWCFEEYKHYTATHTKGRYHVIRVPGLVEPVDCRDEIITWYNYMTTTSGIKYTQLDFDLSNPIVRGKVNEIAAEIGKAKEESFQDLLYSISN